MQAPAFWNAARPTKAARLLSPLGWAYGAIAARRLRKQGERVRPRVICLGNFTLGGAGKTPAALALGERLVAQGERLVFLSRGYRGALSGDAPVAVDPSIHTAAQVGDEPLLLARLAPTLICADRLAGARAAEAMGASVIIMDDGLQNPALEKDWRIAVVDGPVGVGNGLCVPAGPLRAPMAAQWSLIDEMLVIGDGAPGDALALEAERRGKSVLRGRFAPDPGVVAQLAGHSLLAFAGIGRPDKFFDTLQGAGLDLDTRAVYPDHHAYKLPEIRSLARIANNETLRLVTTEKDLVRLSPEMRQAGAEAGLIALPVRLEID